MTTTRVKTLCLILCSGMCLFSGCKRTQNISKSPDQELLHAAENGDKKSMQEALKHGANIEAKDDKGQTALELAAYSGHTALVALLLDMGAREKNRALLQAAAGGPNVLVVIPEGEAHSPLSANSMPEGAAMEPEKTAKLLLDRGADIDARDDDGETPLMVAAAFGRTGTAEILLERGAQIEARDNDGNTALLMAACDCAQATMPDTYEVIGLLLQKGANVNAQNKRDETPLIIASSGGVVKTRIVKLLLEGGADARIKDSQGETALMIARKSDVPDVVRLLEHWKPKPR